MKIAVLGSHESVHVVKLVSEMLERGHEIHLITMHPGHHEFEGNCTIYRLPFGPPWGYGLNLWHLRSYLRNVKPDLLNCHYASGYGTLARLSGFSPNLLSVWGSDVYVFPFKSRINMRLIRANLKQATKIASTSYVMKRRIESIYKPNAKIAVTPFGVDTRQFCPVEIDSNESVITIGTVKTLAPIYGISTLIEAFALLKSRSEMDIQLVLVGGGPQREELMELARNLKVDTHVKFIGAVPHEDVPTWIGKFDIFAALSVSESFGVAVLEASACGKPVVVSDADGFQEIVTDGVTGYIVPRNNPKIAAERLELLVNDRKLREKLGKAGRSFVLDNYEWSENADKIERLYEELCLK